MMKSEVGSRKSEGLAWTPRHSLPFVKVCGLDTAANIAVAVEAGADAIGFVHWEPSVRHRSITEIRCLAVECPVTTVLVTVDLDPDQLLDLANRAGADAVQPHGGNAAVATAAARRIGLGVIHPIKAGAAVPVSGDDLLLIDTPGSGPEGGTGATFDWHLPAPAALVRELRG